MAGTKPRSRRSSPFYEPLLPTLVKEPPESDGWEHEIKYDGYRTQLVIEGNEIRAFTKNGHDWSHKYPPIIACAQSLPCTSAHIDGEVIVQDEHGRSDFPALANAIVSNPSTLVFFGFDLLELDGKDLRKASLMERRDRLRQLIGTNDPARRIQFSESISGNGLDLMNAACEMGLEGIVSKRRDSIYRKGRQISWLKTKCYEETDLLVIGAERAPGSPAFAFLAREGVDGLEYAGSAFVTLTGEEREAFWTWIEFGAVSTPPLPMPRKGRRQWVKPSMEVRVQHLAGNGKLRHATVREITALRSI